MHRFLFNPIKHAHEWFVALKNTQKTPTGSAQILIHFNRPSSVISVQYWGWQGSKQPPKHLRHSGLSKGCLPLLSPNHCLAKDKSQCEPLTAQQNIAVLQRRCYSAWQKSCLVWTFAPTGETQRGGFGHCTTVCLLGIQITPPCIKRLVIHIS